MPKYLIIGNSAGGVGAIEAIREIDQDGSLAVISDEPYPAYSRPMISEFLAGETTLDRMLYRPRDFYSRNDVETIFGKKVVGIDTARSVVKFADGNELGYERLLVATGGVPFVPPTEGSDNEGVYTFTTLTDAERIAGKLDGVNRAVVIGGGLIGISVTEALSHRGVEVTVVELKDRILNVILDEEGSRLAAEAVIAAGVKIVTGATVKKINGRKDGKPGVSGVTLDNGQEIPCEMVIVAIGVVPRLDAIADSGIKRNRGIVVDRHMATSASNVYACGDVAEAYDYVLDISRLTPIWPNAYIGGRTAGYNMAGQPTEYPGGTGMNSLKYFGLAIISGGLNAPEDKPGFEVLTRMVPEKGIYKKVILRDGVIAGFSFVNDIEKSGILCGLMRDKIDVSSFKRNLVADDFDFLSLPRELRMERLGIKRQPLVYIEETEPLEELAVE